jgi:PAS domain-containing protein
VVLGPAVVVATVTGAIFYAGIAVAIYRIGDTPGDRLYVVASVGGVIWAGTYALSFVVFDPTLRLALEIPLWIGRLLVPATWFLAALAYTGRDSYITPLLAGSIAVPSVVTLGLIVTSDAHGLFWRSYEIVEVLGLATASYDPGPWLLLQVAFSYVLIILGLLVILELFLTSELYENQGRILLVAAVLPSVLNVKWLLGLPPAPTLDLSPIAFAVTSVGIGYALVSHDLFSLSPATRRAGQRAAIDNFGDSVFVVDTDDRVVDRNKTAGETLGTAKSEAIGRQIGDVLDIERFDPTETDTVVVETVAGNREFDVTSSALTDRRDRVIGWTLLLHDVTRARRRQQRLSVLDRVMRHNIRNSLSIVMGCAEEIVETGEGEQTELARTIERESAQLVDLSETARTVERVVGREKEQDHVGVATVLGGVHERLLDGPASPSIVIETPDDLLIETDPVVFEEVVFYAVRYLCTDLDESTAIELVAADTDEWAEIAVVGEDISVPVHEQRAIENGRESPLEHTGYLDLWLVNWGVELLGGTLAFDEQIETGQTGAIVLRIPDLGSLSNDGETLEPA